MRFLPISEARNMIASFAEMPEKTVLTRNGQPVAVVMSVQEYRALQALSRLADNPEAAAQVASVHRRVSSGDLDFQEVGREDIERAGTLRTR